MSRQLGHSRGSTTLDVYAHWIPEEGETKQVDVLDRKRRGSSEKKKR